MKNSPLVAPTSGKRVAIFGAGIAGLTVAHELVGRGYEVQIFEANEDAGGFFRSARSEGDHHMPSEYSWHGFGPWYDNGFDLCKGARTGWLGQERCGVVAHVVPSVGRARPSVTFRELALGQLHLYEYDQLGAIVARAAQEEVQPEGHRVVQSKACGTRPRL